MPNKYGHQKATRVGVMRVAKKWLTLAEEATLFDMIHLKYERKRARTMQAT